MEAVESPGIIDGRLWWEQGSIYWELPFYAESGVVDSFAILPDRGDWLAAREALWAIREGADDEGDRYYTQIEEDTFDKAIKKHYSRT